MTGTRKYPGISDPIQDNVLEMLAQLKETVEIFERLRGNEDDSFATLLELKEIADLQAEWYNLVAGDFQNSWTNLGGGVENTGYYRDLFNIVHLKGVIYNGTNDAAAFTLPVGYRPLKIRIFLGGNGDTTAGQHIVLVNPNGSVVARTGNTTGISLDGISFRAEQ